jgi:hypothetical protein
MERAGYSLAAARKADDAFPEEVEPVNGLNDFKYPDLLRRSCQTDPAMGSLQGIEQTVGREPAEDLGEERDRNVRAGRDLLDRDELARRLAIEEEERLNPVLAGLRKDHGTIALGSYKIQKTLLS